MVKANYLSETYEEAKGISGKPKYIGRELVPGGGCDIAYFVINNDNTLYYGRSYATGTWAKEDFKCNTPKEFVKVTDQKVLNMYAFDYSNREYPYEYLTIYAELENGDLVQVKGTIYNGEKVEYEYKGVGKTFKENHPFTDLIMTEKVYVGDNRLIYSNYLISWDKKLYYNAKDHTSYKEGNEMYKLKDSTELKYNNKSVTIKDGFTTENDETNKVFAVGTDNYLYQVNKENTKLEKVSDKKIKDTKYTNDEENNKRYYEITYEDNTTKKYDIINVSTLNKA